MLPSKFSKNHWLIKTATIFAVIFVVVFLFANLKQVSAQLTTSGDNGPTDIFGVKPVEENIFLGGGDIRVVVAKIIRAVLGLLGIISVSLIIYAGYTIMTAGGNEERVLQGRKVIINAVIGLAIIMSAFIIVSFVINALSGATGLLSRDGEISSPPEFDRFTGSGSLGEVVRDHFPFRDQTDVARNTGIAVTFFESVDPASVVLNSNNTCWPVDGSDNPVVINSSNNGDNCKKENDVIKEYYGDCVRVDGVEFEPSRDCDHMSTSSVMIYPSEDENALVERIAQVSYKKEGEEYNSYTFFFEAFTAGDYLGSDIENIWYTVKLTDSILEKKIAGEDQLSIFDGQFTPSYIWQFQTGINLDLDPPRIEKVIPRPWYPELSTGSYLAYDKNIIVKIIFDEAVNPISSQGYLSSESSFTNVIFSNSNIEGYWVLSNGYTILEFFPKDICGTNACGKDIYCLPMSCVETNCEEEKSILVRTAELKYEAKSGSFEAFGFSGITDMSSNALDGDLDSYPDGKPEVLDDKSIAESEKVADNYYWQFKIKNHIELTAPYIQSLNPQTDATDIKGDAILNFLFSETMLSDRLSLGITLEEYPRHSEEDDKLGSAIRSKEVGLIGEEKTEVQIKPSRQFGPNDKDLYYFPKIYSEVTDQYQNCFYPGKGPAIVSQGESSDCKIVYDYETGLPTSEIGCVAVESVESIDTGCVQGSNGSVGYENWQPDVDTCVEDILKDDSVSPPPIFFDFSL